MAYKKTVWKNSVFEKPRTFRKQDNADGSFTLVPAFGKVIESGTKVDAETMNNIENGIESLEKKFDNMDGIKVKAKNVELNTGENLESEIGKKVDKEDYTNKDFNDVTQVGMYSMTSTNKNSPTPTSGSSYGGSYSLIVLRSNGLNNYSYIEQIAIQETTAKLFTRCKTKSGSGGWTPWVEVFQNKVSYGTSEPSGGSNGDIYFQYE